jgi:hypothetical protein
VPRGDLDVAGVDAGVEHGRDEGMAEQVRLGPGDPDPGEPTEAVGSGVPVHPGAAAVEQGRSAYAGSDRLVDGPADCGRQPDQDDLGALAAHAQHPLAVLLAEIGDVRAGGLEDLQAGPDLGRRRACRPVQGSPGCWSRPARTCLGVNGAGPRDVRLPWPELVCLAARPPGGRSGCVGDVVEVEGGSLGVLLGAGDPAESADDVGEILSGQIDGHLPPGGGQGEPLGLDGGLERQAELTAAATVSEIRTNA